MVNPFCSRSRSCAPSTGAGKRIFWTLFVGVLVAVVIGGSTARRHRPTVSPAPAPEPMAKMSSRKLQAHAADNGVLAGAAAAQKAVAAQRQADEAAHPGTVPVVTDIVPDAAERHEAASVPPRPDKTPGHPKAAVRLVRVRSDAPHANKEKALADALIVARDRIAERLRALDPPVMTVPTVERVKAEYLRPDSVTEVQPTAEQKKEFENAHLEGNRLWVEVDVELSEDQVRQLRATDRVGPAGAVAAGAFALALGLFGFLRLDAWTKGYLTTALGVTIGAAVLAAVAAVAVYEYRGGAAGSEANTPATVVAPPPAR